jgi:DMSO/TMAO reductase YedYZ heme-binding membrane subunit
MNVETSANMYLVLSLMHGMVHILLDRLLTPFFFGLSVAFSPTSAVGATDFLILLNL